MNENSAMFFVVDWVSGDGLGDDMHRMPAPGELGALRKGLALCPAFKRVEVAHDVANAQRCLHVVSHGSAGLSGASKVNRVRGRCGAS